MPSNGTITAATAATVVAVTPNVPQVERLGGGVKLAVGAGGFYVTRGMKGMPGAVARGAAIGLAVDGAFDLVLGGSQ